MIVLCILALMFETNGNQAGIINTAIFKTKPQVNECGIIPVSFSASSLLYCINRILTFDIDTNKAEEMAVLIKYGKPGNTDSGMDSIYTAEANHAALEQYDKWSKRGSPCRVKLWAKIIRRTQRGHGNKDFKRKIARIESYNSWSPKESPHSQFWGKYQIGRSVRDQLGIGYMKRSEFVKDTVLQECAMDILMRLNKKMLARHIRKYSGKTINGYRITESGLLAMSHQMGVNMIMKWLDNGCTDTLMDSNRKRSTDYLVACSGIKLNF